MFEEFNTIINEQPAGAKIIIIGVGGGGMNAVNKMAEDQINGVQFVVANTDNQALMDSNITRKILLGETTTKGLGAGAHPEIGKILCDKWHLPANLGEAIYFHHNPSENSDNILLSAIIHLADYTTNVLECGAFRWDSGLELDEKAIEILGLGSRDYVENFIESYREHLQSQLESLPF